MLHINSKYVRLGDIDPQALFTQVDVTRQVSALSAEIEHRISAIPQLQFGER